jgi:site-specific DNA-methyltransferase (adenine-specific)
MATSLGISADIPRDLHNDRVRRKVGGGVVIDKYLNKITCGDNCVLIKDLPDNCIDLTVTSPPYDNLREYNGYSFDFETLVKELYRVTKQGGVVVWIVSDATVNGSETGTSFRQALFFKEVGFNLHDTMIWAKDTMTFPDNTRYGNAFEYMFVFSKGSPKTFNPIRDKENKWSGTKIHGTSRGVDGKTFRKSNDGKTSVAEMGARLNVWQQTGVRSSNERFGHPAPFPERLVKDHIISWSNEGDVVFDPFMGSGTTALCARLLGRKYIGFEISQEYVDMANTRNSQLTLVEVY